MTAPLLATKLQIPPLRPQLVPRARLLAQLSEGLAQRRRLILVSAPAGFGKTTLISDWSRSAGLPCAWLTLDAGDSDAARFLAYLTAALQRAAPNIGAAVQPLAWAAAPAPPQAILTALLNDCAARSEPLLLVLDNYQQLLGPAIHQMVAFLLENLPPALHLAIITREDPPLPLPRLRARGQVLEIRQNDLRFTLDEAAAFFSSTSHLPLGQQSIAILQARTEGWAAGLQLAALAVQHTPLPPEQFVLAFAGDDRYVMDYLLDEVLAHVPPELRAFLQQTALLEQFTAPLCDAVTGRSDSRTLLEQLETANLFVIALDHRREWYRYHQLFGDVLRLALAPAEQRALHERAAQWYWAQQLIEPAIQHALAGARLSGEYAQAEAWIAETAMLALSRGALATLRAWLAAVPAAHIHASADLALAQGWLLATSGDLAQAAAYAERAWAQVSAPPPGQPRADLLLLSALIALLLHGRYAEAIERADAALELLPEEHAYRRLIGLWVRAEATERSAPLGQAIAAFQAARAAGQALGDHVFLITVEMALARALNLHGRREEALHVCQQAIARHTDALGRTAPIVAPILSVLGTLHYEADELELARQAHDQAVAAALQLALPPYQIPAYGLRAPTYDALGLGAQALEGLRAADRLTRETGQQELGWLAAQEADIRMRQGDRAFVQGWARAAALTAETEPRYLLYDALLVYARFLLAQRRLPEAVRLLGRLRAFFQRYELWRPLLSVTIMQALAEAFQGRRAEAAALLETAIQLAAPGGYLRAFLDEGPHVLGLLRELQPARGPLAELLLQAEYRPTLAPSAAPQPLPEPLSERELEVLALMAAGYSNAEIAARLVIAIGTVKRHINNMYAKLDVQSRTQAIAKARSLYLLAPAS